MNGDPFVRLVNHLCRQFSARHEPVVVAQVTLRLCTRHRGAVVDFDDPRLAAQIGEQLRRMPPSRDGAGPSAVPGPGGRLAGVDPVGVPQYDGDAGRQAPGDPAKRCPMEQCP